MKILFCSNVPLSRELGAAKVVIELAEEMRNLGWTCRLLDPDEVCASNESATAGGDFDAIYAQRLRDYLRRHAAEYDVVDYSHVHLPFSRAEFSPGTLFVARSVLLVHHLETIPLPCPQSVKARVGGLLKQAQRQVQRQRLVESATRTVRAADLVNVSNTADVNELSGHRGVDAARIAVIPFGIDAARRPLFDAVSTTPPFGAPMVAFVGTFDYRKGAAEFPAIVRAVASAVPEARFRLLGTRGLFAAEAEVRAHFPPFLRARIEVIPEFQPEALPGLLAPCSVGVFPSYFEGFPFGVLEMLAAAIPVVAYDAPGSPMMLTPDLLARRGDARGLSERVASLLCDPARLAAARLWARERSQAFTWRRAAESTSETYRRCLERKAGAERSLLE